MQNASKYVMTRVSCLLMCLFVIAPIVAQQLPSSSSDTSSTTPLETLTINITNGTPEADDTGTITGVVFDIDKYRSSTGSGERGSLIDELKQHGTRFRTRESSTTVPLDQPVPNPMLVVVYKGGIYQKKLDTGTTEQTVSMTVYEPTRNRDVLRIQRHHMPLQRRRDRLRVSEVIIFKNTGDRTYIGPEGFDRSIPITLPDDVHQVQGARKADDSESQASNTYWLSKTVSPGAVVQARISYHLPLDGSLTLERQIDYPTSSFFFVAPKDELSVTGTSSNLNVQSRSAPSGKGKVYQISASSLSKGDRVSVTLTPSGPPSSGGMTSGSASPGSGSTTDTGSSGDGTPDDEMSYLLIAIGVVAGLSLIVSFSAIVLMYQSGTSQTSESPGEDDLSKEVLVEEIAQLDQDLEDGRISEEYHEQRRSRLKSKLMSLEAQDGPGDTS